MSLGAADTSVCATWLAQGVDAFYDSRVARGSVSKEGEIFIVPGLVEADGALVFWKNGL
jgi:hypothetical protein